VQALDPKNTAMSPDFLMQQMDWREQLADARGREDWHALDRLERDMRAMAQRLERELAILLDDRRDYGLAAEVLRKYRFMEKLLHEIDDAYAEMSP
jgi:molecular chaperone HscB